MNALLRISYADRRAFVNALRGLRRKPGRALMWMGYAIALAGFAYLRTATGVHGTRRGIAPSQTAVADLIVCGFAIAFGLVLVTGTARWLGVFSSRAEALLLLRGSAPPALVAAYLQVRAVAGVLVRAAARFAYVVLVILPAGTTTRALVAETCFFGAMAVAVASVALPRALTQGAARVAAIVLGGIVIALAAVPLVVDANRLLRLHVGGPLRTVADVHPGLLMYAIARGDLRAVAIPLAVAACASAAFALAARDAYPELYALSLASFEFRSRGRNRRAGRNVTPEIVHPPRVATARSTTTWLRGAAAFVWADALAFSRRVSPATSAVVAGVALVAGVVLGALARTENGPVALGVFAGMLPGLYIAIASTTGVRLAPALRMPLFWLGDAPLAARLLACSMSSLWRDGALVALAGIGYAAIARDVRSPLVVLCGALALLALTRAVGLAVFALLPNALDQRGPAVMIRALVVTALGLPAAAGGIAAALLLGHWLFTGTAAAAAVALSEVALLVAFAAYRLSGRVDRLTLS